MFSIVPTSVPTRTGRVSQGLCYVDGGCYSVRLTSLTSPCDAIRLIRVSTRSKCYRGLSQPIFRHAQKCSLGHSASGGVSRRYPSASVWLIFGQSTFLSDAVGWWLTDTDAAYRSLVKCGHKKFHEKQIYWQFRSFSTESI